MTHINIYLWSLAIVFLNTSVHAADQRVTWHFPIKGQTFFMSDVLNASYTTPYPDPRVSLWCRPADKVVWRASDTGSPGHGWTLIALDTASPDTNCWLLVKEVQPNGENYEAQAEHSSVSSAFNVTLEKRAATTIGLALTTSSVVAGASTGTSMSSPTTSSSTWSTGSSNPNNGEPTDPPQSAGTAGATGISPGVVAGVAIGATAISFLIAGLAVLHRHQQRARIGAEKSQSVAPWVPFPDTDELSRQRQEGGFAPHELGDAREPDRRQELPG